MNRKKNIFYVKTVVCKVRLRANIIITLQLHWYNIQIHAVLPVDTYVQLYT